MANVIPALAQGIESLRLYLTRERIRRSLLSRSDHALDDIGVSRELLERGAGLWPWRSDGEAATVSVASVARLTNRLRLRRAFRELEERRDREAAIAGTAHERIADAMRRGRLATGPAESWSITRKRLAGLSRLRATGS